MNFDEIIVKESPGLCRCCLSEGCYKDLGKEHSWMGETEVYADILLECFDISISQHNEGPNGANRLICEVCITRLRDACNFKKQVQESEKKFVDMVGRGEFKPKVHIIYQPPLKAEEVEAEEAPGDADVEYLDEDIDFGDVDESVSRAAPARKRGRPRKGEPKPPRKLAKLVKAEEKTKSSKQMPKGERNVCGQKAAALTSSDIEPSSKTDKPLDKRKVMRENVLQVLTRTTAMPFRWLKSSYRCFFCYDIFQDSSDLKNHQLNHPGDEVKHQTMNNYWEPVVYVDISELSCKICAESATDLYDMIDHLVQKHGVDYNKDVGVCMVAFKLDNLSVKCLACGATFFTFGALLHHTNKDHKGTSAILCDVCGQHFKDSLLLRLHVKTVHENSGLLCPDCGERFETRCKLKTHQRNHHDLGSLKYKCMVCPLTFQSHYKRSRHMAEDHKTRQEIKCLHCPKTFVFRSMMMTHLRDTHLKVRDHVCGVCGWKAFNSHRLKNHMYKHSGEKNFKCDACEKAFTTKKIMRAHFARMHKSAPPMMHYENPYAAQ